MNDNKILLSILIPTVVGREETFDKLLSCILKGVIPSNDVEMYSKIPVEYYRLKVSSQVELVWIKDFKELTIGEKREQLYKKASGLFSWQIDDDDDIADNAIQLILKAIKGNPDVDVISFEEYVSIDGKEFKSNHCNSYADWRGDGNVVAAHK